MKNIKNLRYTDDNIEEYKDILIESDHLNTASYMNLLSTSLKVTSEITPNIASIIEEILNHLSLDGLNLECYVYSDAEMNAKCFTHEHDKQVIVMLSSGLVNRMTSGELAFVIGHELGHFLFDHLNYFRPNTINNELLDMKLNKLTQAQEISADRLGLICSGSIENSIRAIVKTVSGLDDSFITLNLHSYLHQIQSLRFETLANGSYTHPIFPIRAKALMLFSMSELYYWWTDEQKQAPISEERLTYKIRKDLESTTLKNYKNESDNIVEKFKLWFFLKSFIDDNLLDSEEIEHLNTIFGSEMANKAIVLAQDNPDAVNRKYEDYRIQMEYLSQSHQIELLNEMKSSVSGVMSDHTIHKYFANLEKSIMRNFK